MNAKTTMVTLCVGDVCQEFEITHAERLLRLRGTVWNLPNNSQFEFVNDAIRYKENTGSNQGRAQKRRVEPGEISSIKD